MDNGNDDMVQTDRDRIVIYMRSNRYSNDMHVIIEHASMKEIESDVQISKFIINTLIQITKLYQVRNKSPISY